jgi:hypothetical protein
MHKSLQKVRMGDRLVSAVSALDFIDSINSKKHLLLAYSEPSFAKKLEYRFINNGLLKGEHCIVLTHDKIKFIEHEMLERGIDVEKYEENGFLHVYQIPDPTEHRLSILDGFKELTRMILSDSKPPYRIVGRMTYDVKTEGGISIACHFENLFHSSLFENFDGSVFCTYDLEDIQTNDRWQQWLTQLKNCHDASIIQTRDGKSAVIVQS